MAEKFPNARRLRTAGGYFPERQLLFLADSGEDENAGSVWGNGNWSVPNKRSSDWARRSSALRDGEELNSAAAPEAEVYVARAGNYAVPHSRGLFGKKRLAREAECRVEDGMHPGRDCRRQHNCARRA